VFASLGDVAVRVAVNEEPNSNNTIDIINSWNTGYLAVLDSLAPGDTVYISIASIGQSSYTILLSSDETIVELQASKPIQDEVEEG